MKKPRKKGINARKKGASFELKVAAQLTKLVGSKFSRTPSSGGWAKTGDITPKDPKEMVRFPYNIECKNNESWHTSMLFEFSGKRLPSCFGKWWKQCSDDAKKSKKIPIVVFTRNRRPVYCIMRSNLFRKLGLNESVGIYIRIGNYRILLWEEVLKIPYLKMLELIGERKTNDRRNGKPDQGRTTIRDRRKKKKSS